MELLSRSVADPGFPRRGANLLFRPVFHKKCMKMKKKLGPRGRNVSLAPPGSANGFGCKSGLECGGCCIEGVHQQWITLGLTMVYY